MARGGRRKAERAENHTRGPLLLALVAVAAVAVTGGALLFGPVADEPVAMDSDSTPTRSPGAAAAKLDLSALPVTRTLDCAALADRDLAAALGAAPSSQESYVSGDRVKLAPGVTDTAHENLCGFATTDARARVWVFAAPVSTPQARRLVREVRATPRCTFPRDAAGFGTPGLTSVCTRGVDAVVTLRGLFGDAWLSCELTVSGEPAPDSLRPRAARWCVHVATTLGARP